MLTDEFVAAEDLDSSTAALLNELQQPTEEREPQKTEVLQQDDDTQAAADQPAAAGTAKKLSAGLSADLIVGFTDVVVGRVCERVHRGKRRHRLAELLGEAAENRIEELKATARANYGNPMNAQFTAKEMLALGLEKRYSDIIDSIPFTDEEKDKLREPLMKYLEETGGQLPPWLGLMFIGIEVVGTRVADCFFE